MKVVVIGGVAAGPKTAARIKRLKPETEVILIEKGKSLSYAGCGLPYYIAGMFEDANELMSTPCGTLRDSAFFKKVKGFTVMDETLCTKINSSEKNIIVRRKDGSEEEIAYDKLVLATGAESLMPPFEGLELKNIYKLKDVDDAVKIKETVHNRAKLKAVIIGGGLIGLETAEALKDLGCTVTIIELMPRIMSLLDDEMADVLQNYLKNKGITILTKTKVLGFKGEKKLQEVVTDKGAVAADIAVVAVGVKPNISLAEECGLEISAVRAIKVDSCMQTSDENIYAVGDCAVKYNIITGKECYVPLGSTANKEGRVAANNICGFKDEFSGIVESAVCRVFDYTIARTGLSEKAARSLGYDVITCLVPGPDKPHFMDNMKPLFLKLIADKKSRRLLGAQATGPGNAERRIDIAATAVTAGMTVDQVSMLDLTYAPPYSPALDNIIVGANVLRNKIDGLFASLSPYEALDLLKANPEVTFLDVRSPGEVEMISSVEGAVNIPLGKIREQAESLDREKEIIVYCKVSLRGYEAAIILKNMGFEKIKVMDGGILMWPGNKS